MAKRFGTVLVFKKGVSKQQAAQALAQLAAVVDFPTKAFDYVPIPGRDPRGARQTKMVERAFKHEDAVREYDDECGGPVWYIP